MGLCIFTWVKNSSSYSPVVWGPSRTKVFSFLEMETSNRLVAGLKNDIAEILVEEKLLTVTQIKVKIGEVQRLKGLYT